METKVSIVRCSDYTEVKDAIREALELIGGLEKIISPGKRVLLKPNVLSARPPEDAVTTHPLVVKAMCELVLEQGAIPVVGDGSGITRADSTATQRALKASGIEEITCEIGVELINFETLGFVEVEVPDARQFPKLHISKAILDADVVISLPKLKTHELTLYTGAVKNLFGVIPRKERKEAHYLEDRDLFGEAVVDIYACVRPQLAVMDGIVGMEGDGPSSGIPVDSGVIMASFDSVALDIIASELIGFDPMQIPTTRAALERGIGVRNPEITGAELKDVRLKFKLPGGGILAVMPPVFRKALRRFAAVKPCIDTSLCTRCNACVMNCSVNAIEDKNGIYVINEDKCIHCFCCRELCPNEAVFLKKSALMQLVSKIRN